MNKDKIKGEREGIDPLRIIQVVGIIAVIIIIALVVIRHSDGATTKCQTVERNWNDTGNITSIGVESETGFWRWGFGSGYQNQPEDVQKITICVELE